MKWFTWQEGLRLSPSGADLTGVVQWLRHSYLNDLQVASGWLQLGRVQAAMEYLERVKSRLTADSALAAVGDADLEAAVLLARLRAERAGVTFTTRVAGVPDPSYVTDVAAARDRTLPAPGGAGGRWLSAAAGAFSVAVLVILEIAIDRAAKEGAGGVDVTVSFVRSRLEVGLRMAGPPEELVGVVEETLGSRGFVPCGGRGRGRIGLQWGRVQAPTDLSRVAEGAATEPRTELVIAAAGKGR